MNLEYKCSIEGSNERYTAFVTNLQAAESGIEWVEANHIEGYGKQHVTAIDISSSKIVAIPEIGYYYMNLTTLKIVGCGVLQISKLNLLTFKKGLNTLYLTNNLIESLPADVFEFTPNLTHLSLRNNKIKFISKDALTPLTRLTFADFRGNITIDEFYDCNGTSGSRGITFCKLRTKIFKQCKPPNEQMSTVASYAHQLWRGLLSDFTIKAKKEVFKVHKAVLAANSSVFANLFSQESEADVKNEMTIENFQPETVKELLAFVYLRELPEKCFNATDLYAISKEYEINELSEQIEWKIMEVADENTLEMFKVGMRYNNAMIKRAAFHEIEDSLNRNLPEKLLDTEEDLMELLDVKEKLDEILKRMQN